MSTEAGTSDPLQAYSYLSLFPKSFRGLAGFGKPTDLSDLDLVHNLLKTQALKEPGRHIEQARRIVQSMSQDKQSENSDTAAVQEDFQGVGLIDDKNARKRRPGLGRKQAKFTLNRRLNQPIVKEPALDIAKLEDPEDFFLAHERLENAKKELRKQSGIFTGIEVDENDLSLTARPRRPGIPGRLKATYKHHCPPVISNDDGLKESSLENIEKDAMCPSFSLPPESVLSLETSKQNHRSPSNDKIEQETAGPTMDVFAGGSVSKENGFLDEILSGTYDHLNSDGQLILLQEQLQINPIHIDKLSLPKLPDIPKYNIKISENISKPRKSLHGIQAVSTGINTKTHVRASHTPSSIHLSASPTPPKNPLAYLSSLKKRIMESNRSEDPVLDFNKDMYPVEGSPLVECEDKQPVSDAVEEEPRSKFKVDQDLFAASNKSSRREVLPDSRDFHISADGISTIVAKTSSVLPKQPGSATVDENEIHVEPEIRPECFNDSPTKEPHNAPMQSENATHALNPMRLSSSINDQHVSPGAESYAQHSTFPNLGSEQHEVENVTETSINKKTRRKTVPVHRSNIIFKNQNSNERLKSNRIAAVITDGQEHESSGAAQEHESSGAEVQAETMIAKSSAKPDSNIDYQGHSTNADLHGSPSEVPDTGPELADRTNRKSPLNKQSKEKNIPLQKQTELAEEEEIRPLKKQKRKELSLRKSIAVAGTSWKSGVRRSSRLKMRPLEFWRGERFLYGRLEPDSTLPTLIGIKKYDSPARKEGKEVLEVMDCVDGEKYRELIDVAALH